MRKNRCLDGHEARFSGTFGRCQAESSARRLVRKPQKTAGRAACVCGAGECERHDVWALGRAGDGLARERSLPRAPGRQREVSHRYMLGLYELLDRLTKKFPDVLFEGCAGGGRFDPGMLCYMPQNWTSDNTDAAERTGWKRSRRISGC